MEMRLNIKDCMFYMKEKNWQENEKKKIEYQQHRQQRSITIAMKHLGYP